MHRRTRIVAVSAVFTALSLIGASAASASTEVGNPCVGERAEPPGSTLVQLASTSNPGSVTVPVSGVITKWKVSVIPYPGGVSEKLKVLRPAGGNSFTTVGESTIQPIVSGLNSFDTRVPVQAGDRLGAYSPVETIYCEGISTTTDVMGTSAIDSPFGSAATFTEVPKGQLAVAATVEPDVDGDGYGDETQDKCPQNAAVQVPCPVVTLSSTLVVKKGLVNVLVTTSFQAPVTVAGTVKLGKGKSVKLSGGTQIVAPGTIAKFTVLFPKGLRSKLQQLSPNQSLPLSLTATAPNPVGAVSSSSFKRKLPGQAKPKRHKKPKAQA